MGLEKLKFCLLKLKLKILKANEIFIATFNLSLDVVRSLLSLT